MINKLPQIMKEEIINRFIFDFKTLFFIIFLLVFNLSHFQSFAQQTGWVSPKDADNVKNPLAGKNSVLADGKTLYVANCGPCHGDKGRGDGPAAPGLNPKPADHSSIVVQGQTDGAIFWKLSEGRSPMPGYKKIFSEQQRWELINYIRTLGRSAKKK